MSTRTRTKPTTIRSGSDLAAAFRNNKQLADLNPEVAAALSSKQDVIEAPPLRFEVAGDPVAKPRQTRRDVWQKRPSVVKYRTWADHARAAYEAAKQLSFPDVKFDDTVRYHRLHAVAFFTLPASWSKKTKEKMRGQPHKAKPDADNVMKACGDALFPVGDEHLFDVRVQKYWDDGEGPRLVVSLA